MKVLDVIFFQSKAVSTSNICYFVPGNIHRLRVRSLVCMQVCATPGPVWLWMIGCTWEATSQHFSIFFSPINVSLSLPLSLKAMKKMSLDEDKKKITDHNKYNNMENVWNISRVTKIWQGNKLSKWYWENDTNRLAWWAVATNHQFVKNAILQSTVKCGMPYLVTEQVTDWQK